jgi:Plasmid pRiA4b ORF-3-like protein
LPFRIGSQSGRDGSGWCVEPGECRRFVSPPDDCGGIYRHHDFVAALSDANHREHADMAEWIGGLWDAAAFDIEGRQLRAQELPLIVNSASAGRLLVFLDCTASAKSRRMSLHSLDDSFQAVKSNR